MVTTPPRLLSGSDLLAFELLHHSRNYPTGTNYETNDDCLVDCVLYQSRPCFVLFTYYSNVLIHRFKEYNK